METEFFIGICYGHAIISLSTSQTRVARREHEESRRIKCTNVQQIPTPQVEELSDGNGSDEDSAIILTNPHTGEKPEEMITQEHPKPLVEEKPPAPKQAEYVIPDNGYQGETGTDHTVLEEREVARSESGDEQDPPTQNDSSQLGSPELEPRPKRQGHPPTLLTYNTLGNPTYETQAATHVISINSVLGSQLPQCYTPHFTCCAGLPFVHQLQPPANPPLYQHPVIFGYPCRNVSAVFISALPCFPPG